METHITVQISMTVFAIEPALLSEDEHPKGQVCSMKKPFES